MRAFVIALGLPLLAAGARHAHQHLHRHAHAHALVDRAVYTDVVTVTEVTTITVEASSTASSIVIDSALLNSSSTSSLDTSTPIEDHRIDPTAIGNNPFQTLVPDANSAMIKNSCDYPVYVWSAGNPTCADPGANCTLVEPKSTYTETFRKCQEGGVSLKVSKDTSAAKPMQFEYSVWHDEVMVSYDISYLDCMLNSNGEKDLTGCAGHDGGIQAVGGGDCPDYHCLAGKWCDKQAYVVAEFDYKPNAPVGGCTVDKGIAFELCAGNRV